MQNIDVNNNTFTCRQEDEFAIFTILKGAKILSTTVNGKNNLFGALDTVKSADQIKGVAILYSDKYLGDEEYKKFLQESIAAKHYPGFSQYGTTYKTAIIQFLESIISFPKPIIGGMDGDIGPTSFGLNLAFDLRIATDKASFIHPNLQFGLPPSPLLSYFLIQSVGHQKATELILTRPQISAQEALALGFLNQIVVKEDLKEICIEKLRQISTIPALTLIETRRMLQPDLNTLRRYINLGFESALKCLNKINP